MSGWKSSGLLAIPAGWKLKSVLDVRKSWNLKQGEFMINKDPDVYFIEWHDAHSNGGWFSKNELENFINKDKCICQEIGWILNEDKDVIVLACRRLKWAEDGDAKWGMLQKIPKAWLRKKKLLLKA